MLTIAKSLEMEVFASARVVAGEGGLEKPIQWIHMIDIPEMAEWSQDGELLFTTAFGLKDSPDLQATLIPDLVERGVVGMVVGVGRYFHDIPEVMIECANELSFPVIELPWEVPFIEVTRAICENIVRERYVLMQQSLQIHNTLTQLVLMGDDLDALAKALGPLAGNMRFPAERRGPTPNAWRNPGCKQPVLAVPSPEVPIMRLKVGCAPCLLEIIYKSH